MKSYFYFILKYFYLFCFFVLTSPVKSHCLLTLVFAPIFLMLLNSIFGWTSLVHSSIKKEHRCVTVKVEALSKVTQKIMEFRFNARNSGNNMAKL